VFCQSLLMETNGVGIFVEVHMFEHHDVVRASRNRSAGHDFNCFARLQPGPGDFDHVTRANLASHPQSLARAQIGGTAGVAVAGRAIEGRLVAIGQHRPAENPSQRVREPESFGLALISKPERCRVFADKEGGV